MTEQPEFKSLPQKSSKSFSARSIFSIRWPLLTLSFICEFNELKSHLSINETNVQNSQNPSHRSHFKHDGDKTKEANNRKLKNQNKQFFPQIL